jgi:phage terminase small subunit
MDLKLTIKQRLFCRHYLKNGYNGTQAAISAGYSKHSAKEIAVELLTKPLIRQFIDKRLREIEKKLDMDTEYLYSKLKDCIELALIDDEGKKILVNHNALLGAISEVNKMQGNYAAEKREIKHDVSDKTADLIKQYEREF